jgi:hypothetical protein
MNKYYLTITLNDIKDFMGADVDEYMNNLQGLENFYNEYLSNKGLNLDISISLDNDADFKSNVSSYGAISDAKRLIESYDKGLTTIRILNQPF